MSEARKEKLLQEIAAQLKRIADWLEQSDDPIAGLKPLDVPPPTFSYNATASPFDVSVLPLTSDCGPHLE